jgi:ankyrin repeat protein
MLNGMDDSIEQGERLKAARKLTLLSRRAFAVKHYFNASSYQAWEDGKYKKGLSLSNAEKIVRALKNENIDCSIEWLLQGNGSFANRKCYIGQGAAIGLDQEVRLKAQKYKKIKSLNNKLILAIKNNRVEECRGLISSGANLHTLNKIELYLYDRKEYAALHYAARYGGALMVQMFAGLTLNLNIRNRDEDTPIHLAAYEGNQDAIKKLLHLGASIEATNKEGTTPIMWAAQTGQASTIAYLIERGAHVNYTDFNGNTAAHWAAFHGASGAIITLYAKGAYLDIKNNEGKTPLDVAIVNGQIEAVETILSINK